MERKIEGGCDSEGTDCIVFLELRRYIIFNTMAVKKLGWNKCVTVPPSADNEQKDGPRAHLAAHNAPTQFLSRIVADNRAGRSIQRALDTCVLIHVNHRFRGESWRRKVKVATHLPAISNYVNSRRWLGGGGERVRLCALISSQYTKIVCRAPMNRSIKKRVSNAFSAAIDYKSANLFVALS